jgi:SpoVK/Ycf46/Vps4 family AAA+-type ATPase
LIKCDAIIEKELFYNDNEQQSVNTVSEFLKAEKFSEIIKRLEENKMRPGLTILLHGYPGTGKTETIYQLARQTKRNILMVNVSEIRDKWVGESEKRLKAVFETYKNSFSHFEQVPILLFNESDALIGKRINVNTSVDQMNNAMQNILLQELEDFKGILMATTNLTSNLDEAFERRFLFKIKYSKPSHEAKTSIWKSKLAFLSEQDAKRLAEEFDFSGGQIENISRKIFLDSVLLGKTYTLEDTIEYCSQETLSNTNSKKIGF